MASVNKTILVGNIGQQPEIRYLPDGTPTVRISLATTDTWKDKSGDKQQRTEWHRVVFYRKLAEIAAEYLHKGSQIYIEGRLRTQKWTDKQGVERYTTEIIADTMQILSKNQHGSTGPNTAADDNPPDDWDIQF